MAIQALRADASHIDQIAPLFDAYRMFYKQPSNLSQSRAFIAERASDLVRGVQMLPSANVPVGLVEGWESSQRTSLPGRNVRV